MRAGVKSIFAYVMSHTFGVSLSLMFCLGIFISVFVFSYALTNPKGALDYGGWGDFIGGTLNPILTFLTFTGVLFSIFLQRLELGLTRRELERSADALEKQITSIEKQNFEVAFFQMLNTFNAIVDSIDLYNKDNGMESSGRDCFSVFYTRLSKTYQDHKEKGKKAHSGKAILRLSYYIFWKDHQLELGHYFRFLYNTFRFLDESPAHEVYHAKLLRAQLSDQELLLLYYNCLSEQGKKFREYAIKYEIFDNLPTVRLLEDSHVELMDENAFGGNPKYNSKNIRSSF